MDVTSTVVAASTDRHVVAVRQPSTWAKHAEHGRGQEVVLYTLKPIFQIFTLPVFFVFLYFGGKISSHFSNK